MTVTVPNGARHLGTASTFDEFALRIGEAATSHDLIIVGPTVAVDGGFGKHLAFPDRQGIANALIGVGEKDPGSGLDAYLVEALRHVFKRVTRCTTERDFRSAMTAAWPVASADKLEPRVEN